ncbi:Ribonuclease III [Lactobacillus equicursoris 66c]|uniref:Mini-ribonuclease 3 n=1 Tax=Lactobacillus equicursoris 66c TaxID=872326 RepID=K0NVF2_9LACO|nr:ribonuclease III domain-containing protein [Lactobacillus equicursoris]CCK83275.1 Ribonuclease III [Lactobacillus equicursoris 66c]
MNKVKTLTEKAVDPNTLSGQTLAYLGDGVYEAAIRRHLIKGGILKPQNLQREATHYVSAKAQAALIAKMLDKSLLTDEEKTAYKRGRNAKTHTKAKHTSLATYEMSTGFEAIFGYLDLAGASDRVQELIAWCIEEVESEGLSEYVFS